VPLKIFLLLLSTVLLQGCATTPQIDSTTDIRLNSISAKLIESFTNNRPITIRVFSSPDLAAYSHSNGQILLSSTLLEKLTDAELAAAIAHELGHLINDGRLAITAALAGTNNSEDEESAADQTAVILLRATHQNPAALQTMLAKVAADPALSLDGRNHIQQRITRLNTIAP
jgi:Zn-dependent protease with chaperone function